MSYIVKHIIVITKQMSQAKAIERAYILKHLIVRI